MIINMDREPKFSLYYIGAEIIKYLKVSNNVSIETIHMQLRKIIDENLHIDFIYYSLDWLFMIALIEVEEDRVILC